MQEGDTIYWCPILPVHTIHGPDWGEKTRKESH